MFARVQNIVNDDYNFRVNFLFSSIAYDFFRKWIFFVELDVSNVEFQFPYFGKNSGVDVTQLLDPGLRFPSV